MKIILHAITALVSLAVVTSCASPAAEDPDPSAGITTTTPSPAATSASPAKPSPTAEPTSAAPSPRGDASNLTETFTSPDGALSFKYPAGWTVAETADQTFGNNTAYRSWSVTAPDGQITLDLGISAGMAPVGSAPLTVILPQGGTIPGVSNQVAKGARAVVAASSGQAVGGGGQLFFGMAAASGEDTTMFSLPWGENHILSFGGNRRLGQSDQIDFGTEVEQFAGSPQFLNEILPMIQSLTASAPPPRGQTEAGGS